MVGWRKNQVVLIFIFTNTGLSMQKGDFITIKYDPNEKDDVHIPRLHTLDQKCSEGRSFGIGYQNYTPYVDSQWNINDNADLISGIFPHLLLNMMGHCCPGSTVGYANQLLSTYEIQKHYHQTNNDAQVDITFPLYGQDGKSTKTFKTFPFIPIVTAPKIVLLIPNSIVEDVGTRVKYLAAAIMNAWPMWVFTIVSTCLAGLCMWLLDTRSNPNDFPPTFMAGSWDGIWWAFITMTTVGYGDLYPKSVSGRIFSMFWISLGVVLVSLFTGLVSASLNQNTKGDYPIAGVKMGAVRGSIEYQVGVEHNADMVAYENHRDMLRDLKNKTCDLNAVLIDNFGLTAMNDEMEKLGIQVRRELDHSVTYGMVLVHNSSKTVKCFREYVKDHPQEVFEIIAGKLSPVKNVVGRVNVEVAEVGKAFYEQSVFKNLVYAECGLLILALAIGVTYELLGRNRKDNCHIRNEHQNEKLMLSESQMLTRPINRTNEKYPVPDELKRLFTEYNDFHLRWMENVRMVYLATMNEKRTESVLTSVSTVS